MSSKQATASEGFDLTTVTFKNATFPIAASQSSATATFFFFYIIFTKTREIGHLLTQFWQLVPQPEDGLLSTRSARVVFVCSRAIVF